MDGSPVSATLVYRPFAVVMTLVVTAAVGLTWAKVVQTLENAKPAPPRVRPTAIIWGDRVFGSQHELTVWLRSRGAAYRVWSLNHPGAAAVVEHRAPPAVQPRTLTQTPTTQRAATQPAATQPAPTQPAATTSAATTTPAPTAAHRSGGRTSHMGLVRGIVLVLLLLLALVAAWCAALPAAFRMRYPELAERLMRYREQLAAGAAALVIAVIVGVVLS